MAEQVREENKMGTMPIPKLLVQMSLPMMLSMLVQALYNMVDSIFVAQINEEALTAVSLVFPMQSLMIAIATGTYVGVNALLSRDLGRKDFERANQVAKNGIFLALCSYIGFATFGTLLAKPFIYFQTDDPLIREYGVQYLTIISILCIGVYAQMIMERLLQATGKTHFSMISQMMGAVINIIMDPILIFGLFGFPALGVKGAAMATIFGQMAGMSFGIYANIKFNKEININMKGFRPNIHIIINIYKIGAPSIVMQAIGSLTTFGMNKILIQFSSTATAVYGIFFKLNSFIFMPVFGLNNGMIPIIAYNYGARKKDRIIYTMKICISAGITIMVCGIAIFWLFTPQLLAMFNASENMYEIGIPALRIIAISFSFAGYCIVSGSVFQALGNGVYSLINSICRQLVFLLPSAFILANFVGLEATWWSYPIAEIASALGTTYFLVRIYRQKIAPLGHENDEHKSELT
ncbi:MAG: MATE family efflux transporter [Clostridiales bacterium]|nr:MATE family efflux transporter [Clostridiales bacterium]